MKFLITGASGFIGLVLCEHLLQLNHKVRAVTSSEEAEKRLIAELPHLSSRIELIRVDRKSFIPANWINACQDIDVVIHLGARAHVMKEINIDVDKMYRSANYEVTLALARAALYTGVNRFVFVSSIGVNGSFTKDKSFDEGDVPCPQDPYALSKLEAEKGLADLFDGSDGELVVVRSPLVYGPGVKGNFLSLLSIISKGFPLPFGKVKNTRSFIGVRNLVSFIFICSVHSEAAGKTFVISDGQDISSSDLIRILAKGMCINCHIFNFSYSYLKIISILFGQSNRLEKLCGDLQVNSKLARELLGWTPLFSLEEGLIEMAQWYRQIHIANKNKILN